MNMNDLEFIDGLIIRFFSPVAAKVGRPLQRIADGVYEICSSVFTIRIRFCEGHGKSILATIMLTSERSTDPSDLRDEIGVGVVARYEGKSMHTEQKTTAEELVEQAKEVATKTDTLLVPFLLGLRNDFESIRKYVESLIIESGMREKTWNFPKNVREEWL